MPRPKQPTTNNNIKLSAPQRYAAILRTEGSRMQAESIRLQSESAQLLEAADLLDNIQPAIKLPTAA